MNASDIRAEKFLSIASQYKLGKLIRSLISCIK